MSETKTLCYSRDDEDFQFTELGELMDNLASDGALEPGTVYYEADFTPMTHDYIIGRLLIENLLESCDEEVYEEVGEAYDNDYRGVNEEAIEELRALVADWAKKHVSLNCWRIDGKSREKTFTKEEIEEYFA